MSTEFSHIAASPLTWPQGWPRATSRKRAKFHTSGRTWGTGKRELSIAEGAQRITGELRALGVSDGGFIISSNLQLRNDGMPRSGQPEPKDPGVAVYWSTGRGKPQQVMAIDIYDRVADNLAAIAASLAALRAIERHGGAQILERAFTGFTALPPPARTDCWAVLSITPPTTEGAINAAWANLARIHHPDRPGGDAGKMADINAARDEALRIVRGL